MVHTLWLHVFQTSWSVGISQRGTHPLTQTCFHGIISSFTISLSEAWDCDLWQVLHARVPILKLCFERELEAGIWILKVANAEYLKVFLCVLLHSWECKRQELERVWEHRTAKLAGRSLVPQYTSIAEYQAFKGWWVVFQWSLRGMKQPVLVWNSAIGIFQLGWKGSGSRDHSKALGKGTSGRIVWYFGDDFIYLCTNIVPEQAVFLECFSYPYSERWSRNLHILVSTIMYDSVAMQRPDLHK